LVPLRRNSVRARHVDSAHGSTSSERHRSREGRKFRIRLPQLRVYCEPYVRHAGCHVGSSRLVITDPCVVDHGVEATKAVDPFCNGLRASDGGECESAPKRDPTRIGLNSLIYRRKIYFGWGPDRRRSGPPTSSVFPDDFSDLLQFWPGSRFGANSQIGISSRSSALRRVLHEL
jgi:hypothetical protein